MEQIEFDAVMKRFKTADVDEKIDLYMYTEGLSQEQYRSLLRVFPMDAIPELEAALR